MVKLTVKQQRFADEYILSGNAEEAATLAGYSKATARGHSHKLLQNVAIKSYMDERFQELQSAKIADQRELLEILTQVARRESKEMASSPSSQLLNNPKVLKYSEERESQLANELRKEFFFDALEARKVLFDIMNDKK